MDLLYFSKKHKKIALYLILIRYKLKLQNEICFKNLVRLARQSTCKPTSELRDVVVKVTVL